MLAGLRRDTVEQAVAPRIFTPPPPVKLVIVTHNYMTRTIGFDITVMLLFFFAQATIV